MAIASSAMTDFMRRPFSSTRSSWRIFRLASPPARKASRQADRVAAVTADEVMDGARQEMAPLVEKLAVSKEIYREAARGMLAFRGHLSHPVGMTVHDVGNYRKAPLAAGQVFALDPMLWVHEERLYMRIEDVVAVTADGVENFTSFMPASPDEIEKVMREEVK